MIPQYTKPQDTITLLLERVQQGIARRSNPVVIAPQYLLSRRGSETLPTVAWVAQTHIDLSYDLAGVTTPLPVTYVTDIADVTLWGDKLLLELDTIEREWYADGTTPNSTRLRTFGEELISDLGDTPNVNPALAPELARNLVVGDVLICNDDTSGPIRRKITKLIGMATVTSAADSVAGRYNPVTTSSSHAFTSSSFTAGSCAVDHTAWTALVTGAKIGDKAGDVFTFTFSGVGVGVKVDTVKASTGGSLAQVTATESPAGTWKFTVVDTTGNELDVTLVHPGTLANGNSATLTIYSDYTATVYDIAVNDTPLYSGVTDTRIVVEVLVGGLNAAVAAQSFRVSDNRGRTTPVIATGATTGNKTITYLGMGIMLPESGYRKGDVFTIDITAAGESTTLFDGVVLDGPAYDTGLNPSGSGVTGIAAMNYTGQIQESWCSTFTLASSVLTFTSIGFEVDTLTLPAVSGYGTISAGFRSIVPVASSESWITIYNPSEILDLLGTVDPDNPIAYGVSRSIGGTRGYPVYALRTGGTYDTAFSTALVKISNTDMVYALNIGGTQSTTVFTLLKDHCESQSVPTKKNFRRVYLGVDSPGEYLRVGPDSSGATAKAKILDYAGANLLLDFSTANTDAEVDLLTAGVVAGDIVRITDPGGTVTEYEIDSLIEPESGANTTQALLVQQDPVIEAVVISTTTEIWAADTAENQIDYMVAVAKSLGSRRAIVVWCEGGTTLVNGVTTTISSEYIAAEIAGLRCILPPQEGTTTYELTTVTSAPAMYTRYTEDQLNRASANGVMVVCQEYPDGPVFIRHQLTTDTSNGLLAWEDSVGVNLDDQGFQVKDAFVGYRGRKNVTERTRKEITDQLFQLVFNMTQSQVTEEVGPQITGFTDEDGVANKVTVKFHPTFKDRFITFYRPGMPVPLNGIDHTIFGEVQDVI